MRGVAAGGDCDLVTPTGTIKGKGKWGPVEGMEKIFWLQGAARQFVNNPFNYQRVQARGLWRPCTLLHASTRPRQLRLHCLDPLSARCSRGPGYTAQQQPFAAAAAAVKVSCAAGAKLFPSRLPPHRTP